jgi:lysozyme
MKTSDAGRAAIEQREGCKLKAYKDSVGIWTIGVGHTSKAGPPVVKVGMTITKKEAHEILSRDLGQFEEAVDKHAKEPTTQNQFDAMVSLAFNIGGGAFARSMVAKKHSAGDHKGAAEAFLVWDRAGGKKLVGLTNRRKAEREQYLTPEMHRRADPPKSVSAHRPPV